MYEAAEKMVAVLDAAVAQLEQMDRRMGELRVLLRTRQQIDLMTDEKALSDELKTLYERIKTIVDQTGCRDMIELADFARKIRAGFLESFELGSPFHQVSFTCKVGGWGRRKEGSG